MTLVARPLAWTIAFAAGALLGGCATHDHGVQGMQGMQGMHGAGGGMGMSCPMHGEMQQKMAAAKTPEERQALMAKQRHSMMGGACPMADAPAK